MRQRSRVVGSFPDGHVAPMLVVAWLRNLWGGELLRSGGKRAG